MKNILIVFGLFLVISTQAQTVPQKVKNAFTQMFPSVTVKNWDKENKNYEANFKNDGKTMSATFDADGNWLETETDIKISDLPSGVTKYVKTKYPNTSIREAAIITTPQNKKMYEAEVKGKDLLFAEDGSFIKQEQD